ncbi:MAG: glutathione peroxidase [Pseudomonadota bacterium]|nr:glutathione peroxidase [Pseudomonadota bacterium]
MIYKFIISFFLLGVAVGGAKEVNGLYDIEVNTIEGKALKLSEFKNQAILIVNTASKCGYTPQYKGLEALSKKYKKEGLVVLGMPCNQFGQQEPAAEGEIKEFCKVRYGVTFPLLKKADVKGEAQHPLYKFLLANSSDSKDVAWNFEKFLINRKGEVVARFGSKIEPEDKVLIAKIEQALN